eukprot:353090-Chlamydomonas_euryale.AAC.3
MGGKGDEQMSLVFHLPGLSISMFTLSFRPHQTCAAFKRQIASVFHACICAYYGRGVLPKGRG